MRCRFSSQAQRELLSRTTIDSCGVLIVGAGPAGASLASFLAGKGIECILIDKKKRIDIPLRCAEYVPRAI
ncbi:MAG: FAD-dependent monooxygenase, partial [Actinobacteria bacterium]|nr:FAD-dependent monooxygenase [Actinomycetota bacterium]